MAPYVLDGVIDKVSDHKIIEKINETYASQPLIYNHLDQMFTTAHQNSLLGLDVTQVEK